MLAKRFDGRGRSGVGDLEGESATVMVCMGVGVEVGLEFNTGVKGGEKLTSLVGSTLRWVWSQ